MKYCILLLWLFMASSVQAQDLPMSLAGITLGEDISSIQDICRMHTKIPLSQERHLMEVQLIRNHAPGIRSGSVAFANCDQIGRIVRIKLKFDNNSRQFFEDLLQKYRERFGRPVEWRGDPFQKVLAWKWSFHDKQGEQINLELTHSTDEEFKTGNFVKITLRALWVREDACQDAKSQLLEQTDAPPTPAHKLDYRLLIPQ